MKFAICNETYEGWDFGAACADIAESGYDAVEIAPFTLCDMTRPEISENHARKIGDLAKSFGLAVTGFHWLLQKPEGLHLTCPDIEIRKRTKEVLQHLARICAAMGGEIMVFGSPKQRNVLPGETYDAAFGRAVELFRDVCDVAHSFRGDPSIGTPFRRIYELHGKRGGNRAGYQGCRSPRMPVAFGCECHVQ